MKDIKDFLLLGLALLVIVWLLLKGCSNSVNNNIEPKIEIIEKHDTIWAKDTLIQFKSIIKPKYDTIYKLDSSNIDPKDLFFTRIYNDSLSDTNQTIFYSAKTLGMLDSLNISYKLKVPITINNTIEKTITKVETKSPKLSIYTGLELAGNKASFNLSPFISLNINRASVKVGYGILDKTVQLGVGYRLYKTKK